MHHLSLDTRPTAENDRGLALAQALLEQLAYQRDNAINCWTLLSRRFNPFHT